MVEKIETIPIAPYKQPPGVETVKQWGYKGQALDPPTQAAILKINEIIDYLNSK